ncbi:gluatamate dehydrogenase, putative [Plasmodium knowlesi strain H]|uniref:Gluatamate dehydrogenase, putative n=3 Tax=Plasmodium knowlesi TaxID=5850 RepID=A0A5K1UZF0_PLAKH|nr:glutamate dehydrogenase, putative [Plasmodium knowlesi strain H]OTN68647.1 putative Gluatamate dehydrogenase [Plasmodium knowlesi]CAA9986250.1 glutamate dehydrogenase, putative [Plasmodium knowlesi strain H]SBO25460.1 gluatamate dehydrogenase, putative [Plasmodium knowlesi strain H]SBO27739.1 gluatamate dehydrogenase, putative [Plasmodium knowlesi strain H]VVS75724.1 glutamate dehydrogenase, putative [Plasmodium knowlesi strain H]|eukprot:XP_002257659.1 gluatamate dehydrogenase, putative [Plasmodium knowlesi strain H]
MDVDVRSPLARPGGQDEGQFERELFSNNSITWKEKYEETKELLRSYNLFSDHLINYSVDFYFNKLGFNRLHFEETSPHLISKVVVCIITAKINEQYSSDKYFPTFEEKHDNVIFIITRVFANDYKTRLNYKMEKKIEEKYFHFSDMSKDCYRMKSFRSVHSVFDKEHTYEEPLRTYILELPTYSDDIISENETDLEKLMDVNFYSYIKGTKREKIYHELNKAVLYDLTGQFIQTYYYTTSMNTFSLTIAVKRSNVISSIFSLIGDCLNMHRCFSYSKYVEPLKNGVLLIILNVNVITNSEENKKGVEDAQKMLQILEGKIHKIVKSLKTLCLFNDSKFIQLSVKRIFTAEESAYIFLIIKFITFFSTNSFSSYKNVEHALHLRNNTDSSSSSSAIMNDFYIIKEKLKSSKYTKEEILSCALSNVKTIKLLFANFERKMNPQGGEVEPATPSSSNSSYYPADDASPYKSSKDIIDEIEDNQHKKILQYFHLFEKHAIKTNFFRMHKISFAVSFDGALLKDSIYDAEPYSVIMICGLHFVGFHIRFTRISRGGIRIVISNNMNSYMHNYNNLFDEAYNLAYTQNFKNKDIPEGGSKGILLLDPDVCNVANTKYIKNLCFYSYVNSILDLLTDGTGDDNYGFGRRDGDLFGGISLNSSMDRNYNNTSTLGDVTTDMLTPRQNFSYANGTAEQAVHKIMCGKNSDSIPVHNRAEVEEEKYLCANLQNEEDLIFLGPDENTGSDQLMDWACIIAKKRGYKFWKTFSTGKLRKNGGVPHDHYGMTTLGIETYIRKLCEKLNLKEETIRRSIVGGPDGDLGSNAILQSKTKITSIIDGSGVLYDKNGLDKEELIRLAKRRNTPGKKLGTSCILYNEKYLSKDGFKISIEDHNVDVLGKVIKSGLEYRNSFFLNPLNACDLFNPCGGRPHSINVFNVNSIIINERCIYKYIVEGANVFISDDARKILEAKNVILFKDASTNKGGVISSSLEVLAGLVLSDQQFIEMMCSPDSDILLVDENELTFMNLNQKNNHSLSFTSSMLMGRNAQHEKKEIETEGEKEILSNNNLDDSVSPFYKEYVKEIQKKIVHYCELEFESLWSETRRTKTSISQATNVLSNKISELKKDILSSDTLCTDRKLMQKVLKDVIPNILLEKVTFDQIFDRVPYIYLRSLFAAALASNYYYSQQFLSDLSVFNFFEYIRRLQSDA